MIPGHKNMFCASWYFRDPTSLNEAIVLLKKECGIEIPCTDSQWAVSPRSHLDIRRHHAAEDGIREARKSRFDPTKALNVIFYKLM